jgi:release factor glutamine methyltransferase
MLSYKQLIKKYSSTLKDITHIPQKEVQILLLYILNKNIIWLHLNDNKIATKETEKKLKELVQKRSTSYPLEYLIQQVSFYGEIFKIRENILIPRPETEILVEKAEFILKDIAKPKVVEIGVGSGVISIMLALLIDNIEIIAVDINEDALNLAKQNAIKHKVEHKITFIKSNLFDNINVENYNMCISNPPYIALDFKLPINVQYEPSNALFGGIVGDELIKQIIKLTVKNNIDYLACEIGYDQKNTLSNFLDKYNYKSKDFYQDLENLDRGFIVSFP